MPKTIDLKHLGENWPSSVFARSKSSDFTGGFISPGTMANLDSRGEGPPQIRIGRKVGYRVNDFIEWLEKRASKAQKPRQVGKNINQISDGSLSNPGWQ